MTDRIARREFYLITGVMAAGKSTVAEGLAGRMERAVHLRGDVFRRMIVSGREEMSDHPSTQAIEQLHLRYRLAADAARAYYDAGFSVVLQDNYYGQELSRMIDLLSGYPVRLVVLNPDVEAVRLRERSRGKKGYIGFDVEALHRQFLAETPRIGFWLDNSAQTPEQSVDAILRYFSHISMDIQ